MNRESFPRRAYPIQKSSELIELKALDFPPHSLSNHLLLVDRDASIAGGEVTLGSNDLVIMLAQAHALGSPLIEMCLYVDCSAGSLVDADAPELLEGLGALNGRLVHTGALCDLVAGAIHGEGALVGRLRRRVVVAEVLDDVVLDQRTGGPAVDGEVGVSLRVVCAGVGDGLVISGLPSLSTDEVAARLPVHGVCTTGLVGVGDIGTAVGPERVEEAVVSSGAAGSTGTDLKVDSFTFDGSSGDGNDACYCRAGDKER